MIEVLEHNGKKIPIDWATDAACKGMAWFIEDNRLTEKREVCRECPVKAECLAYAIDLEDTSPVVYAGTTGNQRKALLKG